MLSRVIWDMVNIASSNYLGPNQSPRGLSLNAFGPAIPGISTRLRPDLLRLAWGPLQRAQIIVPPR